MNKVILTGYLASDPELKYTPSGLPVAEFSLAVRRPYSKEETTDFINIQCWRNTAEFLAKHYSKGSGIELSGEINTNTYTDKSGNKRTKFYVVANDIEFGKNSKTGNTAPAPTQKSSTAPANDQTYFDLSDDDQELPF